MTALAEPVEPGDRRIRVYLTRLRIDDEIMHVLDWPVDPRRSSWRRPGRWHVLRGREGTTPAPHAEGAQVTFLEGPIPPEYTADGRALHPGDFLRLRRGEL